MHHNFGMPCYVAFIELSKVGLQDVDEAFLRAWIRAHVEDAAQLHKPVRPIPAWARVQFSGLLHLLFRLHCHIHHWECKDWLAEHEAALQMPKKPCFSC